MEHEPCSFLSYTNRAVNLPRANPVFGVGDHPYSSQPLIQAQRRILKDGSSLDRELTAVVALVALPAVVLRLKYDTVAAASRADDAIGPAASYYILAAILGTRKVDNRFLKGGRLHESDYALGLWSCQVYSYPN
jgi:hypothetical protein